ncbi:MAG: hypothetical protein GF418_10600 [Chitinivibrionales bacterium]|nr:hypothetical protein [Chitinivibrionales bacterium]MBD3396063.1 hypothetical protein [Chitinivibrionales bacterium]
MTPAEKRAARAAMHQQDMLKEESVRLFAAKALRLRSQRGVTLVEVLVAAAVIIISTMGVVAVTRSSRQTDVTFNHRRAARAIIDSCFESISYHYSNYQNLANISRSVVVDPRTPETPDDDLTGSLSITVTQESAQGAALTTINHKQVVMSVTWNEPEGQQSVTLTKCITQL